MTNERGVGLGQRVVHLWRPDQGSRGHSRGQGRVNRSQEEIWAELGNSGAESTPGSGECGNIQTSYDLTGQFLNRVQCSVQSVNQCSDRRHQYQCLLSGLRTEQ